LGIVVVTSLVVLHTSCKKTGKKEDSTIQNNDQNLSGEVSMKPTASDADPAWVYFTADSSGYNYTFRIKSNGTGLEKLYESKAEPIWISPDNRYVYIKDQVKLSYEQKDPFCPKGITIWDIEKKEKKVLPFYDEPTWGSGWYDNDNILYSKFFISSEMIYKGDIGYNTIHGLFKQNINTGDTSIIFYWDKGTNLNAVYNKIDNNYYYISDDSLYAFKGKSRKYQSFPVEYHDLQANDGPVMFTNNYTALFFHNFDTISGRKDIVTDLKGKTLLVIDKSIDQECRISWVKIDKSGNWVYYKGHMVINDTVYSMIKRKNINRNENAEIIIMTKSDEMSIGYIALGYDN
jgi:hypothetical protein